MPGLGRLHAPDPRDLGYKAEAVLTKRVPLHNVMHPSRYVLDQGETGTCVGHGWKGLLLSGPVMQGKPDSEPQAKQIYCEAIAVDEWTSNDNDCGGPNPYQYGTSVRAGAKALQARGLLQTYRWATDASTVLQWLIQYGPVVLGTIWYNSMFKPTKRDYLRVDQGSGVAGGHCYLLLGYNVVHDAVRMLNSWGSGWGRNGRAWIDRTDLDKLIRADGEACMTLDTLARA